MSTELQNDDRAAATAPGADWPRTVSDPADARTTDEVDYSPAPLDRTAPFYVGWR